MRGSRALSALGALCLIACDGGTPRPSPATAASAIDRGAATSAIARELDDFHDAAAHADEARYFAHFSADAVFLGTDATERWDLAAFRAFAHPHFASGKAWSFHATRRAITVSDDGRFAYFDEDLETEKLGPTRGAGVLVLRDGAWKIAQYNLAVVVPNERFVELRALLERPAGAVTPFEQRYKAVYQQAVLAAAGGDVAAGERALSGLLDEALAREGDDTAFWLHNDLTWLRWSEGDLAGALREVDGAKTALAHAGLKGDASERLGLHEKWDRAYILLELARDAPLVLRSKALAAADAARADYERAAAPLGDHDGMAVLAAFFAVRAGDAKGALGAARRVDPEKDTDLQDIYVLALAYDLGGDHAQADALRKRIREGRVYLMQPLLVSRMKEDATTPGPRKKGP